MNTITVDKKTYSKLRKEYDKAVKSDATTFKFGGVELLTSYAKYLLQHMKGLLKRRGDLK